MKCYWYSVAWEERGEASKVLAVLAILGASHRNAERLLTRNLQLTLVKGQLQMLLKVHGYLSGTMYHAQTIPPWGK